MQGNLSKEEIEKLLRHGAYEIFNEDKTGQSEAESNAFVEQDIDSILERRAKRVVHENTGSAANGAGSTFSKASFKAKKGDGKGTTAAEEDVDVDDPDFWKKIVGEGTAQKDRTAGPEKKRKRKAQNYSEKAYDRAFRHHFVVDSPADSDQSPDGSDSDSGSDASFSSDTDDTVDSDLENEPTDVAGGKQKAPRKQDITSTPAAPKVVQKPKILDRKRWGRKDSMGMEKKDAERLIRGLCVYGYGNKTWTDFKASVGLDIYSVSEVCTTRFAFLSLVVCGERLLENLLGPLSLQWFMIRQLTLDAHTPVHLFACSFMFVVLQIKRMSWAMTLEALCECAHDEAKKVAEKEATKAEDATEIAAAAAVVAADRNNGGVLATVESTKKPTVEEDPETAFQKLWTIHEAWASLALVAANAYSEVFRRRKKSKLDIALGKRNPNSKNLVSEEIRVAFTQNLWPALQSRGWKTEEIGTAHGPLTGYVYKDKKVRLLLSGSSVGLWTRIDCWSFSSVSGIQTRIGQLPRCDGN